MKIDYLYEISRENERERLTIRKENNFVEISKNLAKYTSENILDRWNYHNNYIIED